MPYDVNLQLAQKSVPLTGTGALPHVLCEGGFRADIEFHTGVVTDTNETFNLDIEASKDDGANYFPILTLEQITNDEESTKISRSVYIPRPTFPATKTRVRANVTAVGGTTPSLPVDIFIAPLLSLAPPAQDESLGIGLAKLYT